MSTIGQYKIRELLGEGGSGQVHVGFDTVLEREVAIKSLRPELLNDKNFIARFRGEAKSLALLNHPNITTLYALLHDGAKLSMVMELVRGDTLDIVLKKRNGTLGVAECLAIIAQAADGLSYAHSMGVIHRDIKPANLMITPSGLLKIMDFGIARVRGSQRLTRDGSMVGTLAYMAPEQLRGEPGDERSDLYSLAIVLYEMLSGATPFAAQSDYELMQMQISARPQRLVGRLPDLDGRIDAALMRALAKKPEQRFASVGAFRDALGAAAPQVDASINVIEGTRLIGRPAMEAMAVKSGISDRFDQVSAAADRLHWLPVEWRTPVVVGIATLVVVGGLAAGALTLMPAQEPTSPPAPVRPVQSDQRPAVSPSVAVTPPSVTVAPPSVAVTPITAPESTIEAVPNLVATPLPPSPPNVRPNVASASPSIPPVPGSSAKADIAVALGRKDYAGVFELSRPLAEGGDRDAQFRIAFLLDTGQGVPRDDRQAAAWYRKAADQGHILAQYNLGRMFENGRGVEQSDTQAFNWFRKAADQGDSEAQNRVGTMYVLGQGTRKDEFEAVSWYEKAAKQGLAKALTGLGNMYASGRGVAKRDDREAFRLYREAAEQKYAEAENNVGWWYEHGLGGVPQNYRAAGEWYQKAAEHGSGIGRDNIGRLRASGHI